VLRHPLASPALPLPLRSSDWGSVSEFRRYDYRVRQIRALPPGSTRRDRRLLTLHDCALPVGGLAGLLAAVLLRATAPLPLVLCILAGATFAAAATARATRRLRSSIRSLVVTEWTSDPVEGGRRDRDVFRRCLALADRLDGPARMTPVERECVWAELYFLLPPRGR
jgi:hypothetical protein